MIKTEVLIIGGGVPGLALALLLGQKGADVCVVDTEKVVKLKDSEVSSRTVALWDASIDVIQQTGIWDTVKPYSQAIETLRIVDDSSKQMEPVIVDFKAQEIGLDVFGYNIPNSKLRAALVEALSKVKTVKHIAPARLKDYHIDGSKVMATLQDDSKIQASLIIAADGRQSITRDIAGIEVSEQDYGQSAMTCVINHTKSHDSVSTEHHRPGGPFTTVPMPKTKDGWQCAVVWMEKNEDAQRFMRFEKHNFETALQERTRGALGKVTLASNPQSWPIITQHSKALSAERCALMAETAHVMSPIGAQGLNLSLRDVASLYDVIIGAMQVGEDIGSQSVLRRYERQRRADIQTRVFGIDTLNKLVSNNKASLRALRRVGLKTIDALPMLKEFTMMQGIKARSSLHNAGKR